MANASSKSVWRLGLLLVVLVGLAVAWRATPLREWLDPGKLLDLAAPLLALPYQPILIPAIYVVASFVVFPVTLLILCTVLVYGASAGLAYAAAGVLASAASTYATGRVAGRDTLEWIAGSRFEPVARHIRKGSLTAITVVRLVPVAPFTVVNMVAGAVRFPFPTYLAGTMLGMAPGTIAIAVFRYEVSMTLESPGPKTFAALGFLAVVVVALGLWIRRKASEEIGD